MIDVSDKACIVVCDQLTQMNDHGESMLRYSNRQPQFFPYAYTKHRVCSNRANSPSVTIDTNAEFSSGSSPWIRRPRKGTVISA